MKIQSLSIHVPTKGCINKCKFCVSLMHDCPYENRIGKAVEDKNHSQMNTYFAKMDYENRMFFAKENGVNTVILTGVGEVLQNPDFLDYFYNLNRNIKFRWIEVQTAGNMLFDDFKDGKFKCTGLQKLRETGVNTISLSLSDMFDSENNRVLNGTSKKQKVDIDKVCKEIKRMNMNLRLSLNMTDVYNGSTKEIYTEILPRIFKRAKELGADQITFRKLYMSPTEDTEQDKWIKEHAVDPQIFSFLSDYIVGVHGRFLGVLPFGAKKYSVDGISTVIDDNCMDNANMRVDPDAYKYLILRPNCKLYSHWDDKGSLIF